ncbi:MAG: hypothetical protein WCL14_13335 [Bacteroidota bacterium]
MGHVKEPEGVDFIINSRPLTKEEEAAISKYIQDYKTKKLTKPLAKKEKKTSIHHA